MRFNHHTTRSVQRLRRTMVLLYRTPRSRILVACIVIVLVTIVTAISTTVEPSIPASKKRPIHPSRNKTKLSRAQTKTHKPAANQHQQGLRKALRLRLQAAAKIKTYAILPPIPTPKLLHCPIDRRWMQLPASIQDIGYGPTNGTPRTIATRPPTKVMDRPIRMKQ